MAEGILVFAEQRNGQLMKAAKEVLTAGYQIAESSGTTVSTVVVGDGVSSITDDISQFGASTIYVADDGELANYSGLAYAEYIRAAIEQADPAVVLFPADSMGQDLAPVVAAKLGVGNGSDVTEIQYQDGTVTAKRPVYAGKSLVNITFQQSPAVLTVRPNTYPPEEHPGEASVENLDVSLPDNALRVTARFEVSESERPELTEANRIVSGGRGVGSPEDFEIIEKLADAMSAAVGASRAVTDAGWRPYSEQVGQTGKTVSPALYVACGISGAIQHLAGMRSSKVIVAINKDPDAPIFKVADYGITGDLFEVVPRMIEELKNES
ncbi:MAG: electron transfer flavoprotein subunit alpha/FixB family protein [Candidatus Marinimicrobia bacterium]|nr:electron transfer flavoprotein subunit alpha/FixB family protein [Candidatus Neomarinimicrobiota bacterium]MCF7827973.1 electron transfer flavoprotein subunit alpha/FixB family protein [Candidatus Neomarinimicrobiota bacterium]MCF7879272.1 electron transfer flavoprotein subunit alpha/FixB family protein [Candidatus Neomarinimicrobiota bacterium]